MKLMRLTMLAMQLTQLLDKGGYDLPVDKMGAKIQDKTVFAYLKRNVRKEDLDMNYLDTDDKNELLSRFEKLFNVTDAKRKFGVANNGLCLLLAYVLAIIQEKRYELIDF